jgi:hypothetical protein
VNTIDKRSHFALRRHSSHARSKPRDADVSPQTALRIGSVDHHGQVEVSIHGGDAKTRRHHSQHRPRDSVDPDRVAHHPGIAAISALPERVA